MGWRDDEPDFTIYGRVVRETEKAYLVATSNTESGFAGSVAREVSDRAHRGH